MPLGSPHNNKDGKVGRKKMGLAERLNIEKSMLRELDSSHLRFALECFRDKNINKRKYQKELINTFIKAIYVYDGSLKIVLIGTRQTT